MEQETTTTNITIESTKATNTTVTNLDSMSQISIDKQINGMIDDHSFLIDADFVNNQPYISSDSSSIDSDNSESDEESSLEQTKGINGKELELDNLLELGQNKKDIHKEVFQRLEKITKTINIEKYDYLKIVEDWNPKQELVHLFLRWSRKEPREFNSDSISLLNTICKQIKCSPEDLLTKYMSFSFNPKNS